MTTTAQIYEGMFLLDNQVVRGGWPEAKALVTGTLEKHGGTVLTARRWDERRITYKINHNRRATYLLVYYELPGDAISAMRRDFDLSEGVMRYLQLAVDEVPEGEKALSDAELDSAFVAPEPLPDDAPTPEEEAEAAEREARARPRRRDSEESSGGADGAKAPEGETPAEDSAEAPAEAKAPAKEEPAAEAPSEPAKETTTGSTESGEENAS